MANNTARSAKLADRIKVVVAETLKTKIKDPRLGFVTITDTRITGDLREATVFYTVFGDEEERAASAAALESAKGILRSELGRRVSRAAGGRRGGRGRSAAARAGSGARHEGGGGPSPSRPREPARRFS